MDANLSAEALQKLRLLLDPVSNALNSAHFKPHHIEILPDFLELSAGCHVEVSEGSIFVNKKTLIKAFLAARHIFATTLSQAEKYSASSVLLLLHPQYETAANFRKECVKDHIGRIDGHSSGVTFIRRDLCYLESLFRSPLNRHTKSPTLWAHRTWLMKVMNKHFGVCCSWEDEISIVLAAAEIHPKNYYAWSYLRWFREFNIGLGLLGRSPADEGFAREVEHIQKWCLNHPSDTSGWSYLYWLLFVAQNDRKSLNESQFCSNAFEVVLSTARSLKLRNEATWGFLRTLSLHTYISESQREDFRGEARNLFHQNQVNIASKSMQDIQTWLGHS